MNGRLCEARHCSEKATNIIEVYVGKFGYITLSLCSQRKEEFLEFCNLNNKQEIAFFLKEIAPKFLENLYYSYTRNPILSHLKVRVER